MHMFTLDKGEDLHAIIYDESSLEATVTSASNLPTVMIDELYDLVRKEEYFIVAKYPLLR